MNQALKTTLLVALIVNVRATNTFSQFVHSNVSSSTTAMQGMDEPLTDVQIAQREHSLFFSFLKEEKINHLRRIGESANCPDEQPDDGDSCENEDDYCPYGEGECCCDDCFPETECYCTESGAWECQEAPVPGCFPCDVSGMSESMCFAGDTVVTVKDKGFVPIRNVRIGDYVQVARDDNKYEQVYSLGANNKEDIADFLQIFAIGLDQPLVITKEHFLLVQQQEKTCSLSGESITTCENLASSTGTNFITASMLQVGDKLVSTRDMLLQVTKIEHVRRRGFFSPFTPSGTIIVNGEIVASTFGHRQDSDVIKIGESWETPLSAHTVVHMFMVYHRLTCLVNWDFCKNETYTRNGISNFVAWPHDIYLWWLKQHPIVMALVLLFVLAILFVLNCLEAFVVLMITTNSVVLLVTTCAAAAAWFLWHQSYKKSE